MLRTRSHTARSRCDRLSIAAIVCLTLLAVHPASAQDPTSAPRSGWLVGGSVGLPGDGGGAFLPLTMVGAQATQLRTDRLGVDLSVMTAPYPLAFGIANVVAHGGGVLPLEVRPNLFLLPVAGVTALAAGSVAEDGAGAAFGLHAGVSALVLGGGSTAVRVGLTWHRFREADESVWLMEIGLGRLH
jgi:hypothetical protein